MLCGDGRHTSTPHISSLAGGGGGGLLGCREYHMWSCLSVGGLQRRFGVRVSVGPFSCIFDHYLAMPWLQLAFECLRRFVLVYKIILSSVWRLACLSFTKDSIYFYCSYFLSGMPLYFPSCSYFVSLCYMRNAYFQFFHLHTCRHLWTHTLIPTHPHDYLRIYTHYFIIQDCICIYTFIDALRLVDIVG